jgi:ankyrin repeat protein
MNLSPLRICGLATLLSAASLFGSGTVKPDGTTPLHDAVYRDDIQAITRLLHEGADAKAVNRYGVTPLSLACVNGDAAAIELLLKAGADPNTSLPGGETALMTCARTGKVSAVKVLIAHGANVNAKETSHGQNAIMWAAAEGNAEVVEALIQAGADFRERLQTGFDPFLFAVRNGQIGVVRALLKAGVDVNDTIQSNRTFGSPSQGLTPPRNGTSALVLAVENGHFELASDLLDAGADPNAAAQGWTALHAITWVRKPGGGDNNPAPVGSGNMTSLELVKKLVAKHADINARMAKKVNVGLTSLNTKGATPFFLAARTADAELMRALVALGANPKLNNADNSTPLMAAAGLGTRSPGEDAGTEKEVVEAMKVAIDLGNDPNAVDDNGETAMHGAAYKNLPEAVLFLASHGADIKVWNRPNKHGWTPLVIAEGYRFGNYKPSAVTVAALHKVMSEAGVPIPSAKEIAATAHSVP